MNLSDKVDVPTYETRNLRADLLSYSDKIGKYHLIMLSGTEYITPVRNCKISQLVPNHLLNRVISQTCT